MAILTVARHLYMCHQLFEPKTEARDRREHFGKAVGSENIDVFGLGCDNEQDRARHWKAEGSETA